MRYSESRKDETHTRLLKIAGRSLREKGPQGVVVAEVMRAAGLTHGGFYAHFPSKDALLSEALCGVFAQSRRKFLAAVEGLPPRHALATFIDFYVSERHRDHPASGCAITALNSDLPRQSKRFRAAFDAGVKVLVDKMTQWIAEAGHADAERLAASILSAMAGAVAISRAVSDRSLSDRMLEAARESIKARLGVGDAALSRSARP